MPRMCGPLHWACEPRIHLVVCHMLRRHPVRPWARFLGGCDGKDAYSIPGEWPTLHMPLFRADSDEFVCLLGKNRGVARRVLTGRIPYQVVSIARIEALWPRGSWVTPLTVADVFHRLSRDGHSAE